MSVYYNEFDPFAAAWLRELMKDGQIPEGVVDERSITEVTPDDVRGFTQCHFFAGIGGWAYALQLAGWGAEPVWTGSCPCQPFSAAGKGGGTDDKRHLWPEFFRLIRECRPRTVFGEQVESAIAHGWLDLVSTDLERENYAVGAVSLPACSVGAFHRRQRLWFVAESNGRDESQVGPSDEPRGEQSPRRRTEERAGLGTASGDGLNLVADGNPARRGARRPSETGDGGDAARVESAGLCAAGELADTVRERRQQVPGSASGDETADGRAGRDGRQSDGDYVAAGDGENGLADADGGQSSDGGVQRGRRYLQRAQDAVTPWADVDWLPCRDDKWRPTQPGLFPLAHGVPNRVGTLRGAGNAIVPQVAAEVVKAYLEIR